MYAVIRTGGRQYRAEVGETIDVEKLPFAVGDTVNLDEVLLVADGGKATVGTPLVKGASVTATVVDQYRDRKSLLQVTPPRSAIAASRGIASITPVCTSKRLIRRRSW
jgi:large subunit ribosomal protein L21